MRVKIVLQKVYVAFVLLVLLTIQVSVPVVNANDEVDGSVTTFGFNNPAIISNVYITDSGGSVLIASGSTTAALTRNDSFFINFTIFDLDGFANLDVYIALFNNDLNEAETSSGVLINEINSGVKDRAFVLRWLAPERSTYLSGLSSETFRFPITAGASSFLVKSGATEISSGTYNSGIFDFVTPSEFNLNQDVTWEVTSGVAPVTTVTDSGTVTTTGQAPTVRNIEYTVRVPFKMSKVAPSSGVWNLGIMVHDRLQQEIIGERTNVMVDTYKYAPAFYRNQWYGEVLIVNSNIVTFTNVEAGSGFQTSDQSGEASGIQVRFTSNGTYNQTVTSDTTWIPAVTIPTRPIYAYLVFNSGFAAANGTEARRLLNEEGNRFSLGARRIKLGDGETNVDALFVEIFPTDVPAEEVNFILPLINSAYRPVSGDGSNSSKSSNSSDVNHALGTDEFGVVSIFEFQLRLSPVFQNTTYSGNLSIGVSNAINPGE